MSVKKMAIEDDAFIPAAAIAALRATAAANQNWALFDFYTPRLDDAGGDVTANIPADVAADAMERIDAVLRADRDAL